MADTPPVQLNIRSRFARERANGLARETGMTVTQIVEEALRAYQPAQKVGLRGKLVRKGNLLVRPAGRSRIRQEVLEEMLEEVRNERG